MTAKENVLVDGASLDVENEVDSTQQLPPDPGIGAFSNQALIQKLLASEDRFHTFNGRIDALGNVVAKLGEGLNNVINHINSISGQFNETVTMMKQITDALKNGGNHSNTIAAVQPVQQPTNAETIVNNMQQPQNTNISQQGILGNIIPPNSGGIPAILDRVMQFYMMTKGQQTADPTVVFMDNLQSSMSLLKTMHGFVADMKDVWMKEERLAHQIEKSKITSSKKGSDK